MSESRLGPLCIDGEELVVHILRGGSRYGFTLLFESLLLAIGQAGEGHQGP